MCFVPVECVTFVRFNRYRFVFIYDPLSFFEEMGENSILINLEGEGDLKSYYLFFSLVGEKKCIQIVVIR